MSNLIGSTDVARILGVDRQTVWRLHKRGELKAEQVVERNTRSQFLFNSDYIAMFAKEYAKKKEEATVKVGA